jgi:hypothetical protein
MLKPVLVFFLMFFSQFSVSQVIDTSLRETQCEDSTDSIEMIEEPLNCVNPGGSCDGSTPCCDSYNNACIRNRCRKISTSLEPMATHDDQPLPIEESPTR